MEMWVGVVMGLDWAARLMVPTMWAFYELGQTNSP